MLGIVAQCETPSRCATVTAPCAVHEDLGVLVEAPVHPGDAVTDLEARVLDGADEPVIGARPAEREEVRARLQNAEHFAPQGDVEGDLGAVPRLAHKPGGGYILRVNEQVERECPACRRRYHANASRLKFGRETTCSRPCSYRLRASKLQRAQQCECGACGKPILVCPSKAKRARHGALFCSSKCAYSKRQRVVLAPYVIVSTHDRSGALKKAWKTRRINAKPYPETARKKARADAIKRLVHGDRVSKFEREAAEVFRRLGFLVQPGVGIRRNDGTYAHVIDIVLPTRRIAIECQGTYWHGGRWSWSAPDAAQAKNLLYEERKLVATRAIGLDVRHLWEHEFKRDPCGACLAVAR
jgi:G:T-mismatch repair DNA endonuclease (very short patch repair protein)